MTPFVDGPLQTNVGGQTSARRHRRRSSDRVHSASAVRPLTVTIGGKTADILCAGAAPGLVAGVFQIDVKVPEHVEQGEMVPLVVRSGTDLRSPGWQQRAVALLRNAASSLRTMPPRGSGPGP